MKTKTQNRNLVFGSLISLRRSSLIHASRKLSALAVALGLGAPATFAAINTWIGNTDANWNTAANWSPAAAPANGDSLVFGAAGSAGATLNNDIAGLAVSKLTFNSGASSFTFGGNSFTNGTGGIDASALTSGTQTINSAIFIGNGVQRWTVGAGATLATGTLGVGGNATHTYDPFGGILIVKGTVTTTNANGWAWRAGGPGLLGPGVVIDNGNNTYDWAYKGAGDVIVAPTYVAPGTGDKNNVKVTANATLSLNASWASLLVSNATFTVNGSSLYFDTGIILEAGGTITGAAPLRANSDGIYVYVPNTGTITSSLQNNGANAKKLYKAGPGTLSLTGNSSYTGGTVLYEGTVSVGGASALGNGPLTMSGGNLDCSSANLNLNNNIAQNWNADFTFNGSQSLNFGSGTVTLNASRQVTVSSNTLTVGPISDGGMGYGLTKTGNGTLKLGGGYSHTGPTLVTAGTLSLDAAQVSSSSSALTVSNAALTVSLNDGSSSISAAGLTFGGSSTLNLNFGTATSPAVPAINATSVSITGTTTVNITGPSLVLGQYPLISTGGSVPTNNFVLGAVPLGMSAVLTNSGTSLDLLIISTGQNLTWYGADNAGNPLTTWNINTSSNWNSGNAKYLQYSGNSYGDYVTFDDTLFTPSGADVVLNTAVVPSSVTFNNSSTPYSITGSGGIAGATSLVKSGGASVYLGTVNSYTGGTVINNGTVIVTNDNALGASGGAVTLNAATLQISNTTASARGIAVTANSTVDVVTNANAQLTGVISGTAGLTKTGNGTLSLSGANTFSGAAVVSAGELRITGGNSGNASQHTTGNAASTAATLTIAGGTFQATRPGNVWESSLQLATAGGAVGRLKVDSGTLIVAKQLAVGANALGYGIYSQVGGDATVGGFLAMGLGSDQSIFNQSGGTYTMTGAPVTCGAGGTGLGIINLSGTAVFNHNSPASEAFWVGEGGVGILNLSGSAALNIANSRLELGRANAASASGTANLLGGTLTTPSVAKPGAAATGVLNFNGGTLKAKVATANFMTGLTAARVYSGGAVVDDGGFAITIAQPLLAPTGDGVASISVDTGGSGYIDTPIVTISGDGSGATAVAIVSGGVVTGFTVTCPGVGYTTAPTVTMTGGGGTGAAGTASLAANTSGGLTKIGNGTLTLNGVSTYTGPTRVNAGTLAGTGTIAGSLTNSATLAPGAGGAGALTVNGNIILNAGSTNLFSVNGTTTANTSLIAGGNVTYGGVLKIATNGTFTLGQTFTLFSGTGTTNASNFASIEGSPGSSLAFSFTNGLLSVVSGIASDPTNITFSVSGGSLNLSWPSTHLGWILQSQTNSRSVGLATNWFDVSGSGAVTATNFPVNAADPTVFYRLRKP